MKFLLNEKVQVPVIEYFEIPDESFVTGGTMALETRWKKSDRFAGTFSSRAARFARKFERA